MKNRFMIYILAGLVLVAVVYRIGNPPEPAPPGPAGEFPNWRSVGSLGEMSAQAVDQAGAMWAGVWNEELPSGAIRSAVWIIGFERASVKVCRLADDTFAPSLGWMDERTVWVLSVDNADPSLVSESSIVYIDAWTGKRKQTVPLKPAVARILAWPVGSGHFLAQIATKGGIRLAVMMPDGRIMGKPVEPKLPRDAEFFTDAALSPRTLDFVFSVSDPKAAGGRSYYLGTLGTPAGEPGSAKRLFDLKDVPGRIEGMWIGDLAASAEGAGGEQVGGIPKLLLITGSVRKGTDRFQTVVLQGPGEFTSLPKGAPQIAQEDAWLAVPREMLFVTYNGGYRFDLTTGKTTRLFDLKKFTGPAAERWRQEVRNGRLYQIENGYISVSLRAGAIDIRQLGKDGHLVRALLPRT